MQEFFDAGPLEADGVDHAGGDFGDAGSRVAVHRVRSDAFDDDRAENGGIEKFFVFASVAECSGGCHDGVRKLKRTEFYREIRLHSTPPRRYRRVLPCRCANSASRRARRDLSF